MDEIYYNVSEAAYILGVSEAVVLRGIRKGELQAFWKEKSEDSPRGYRVTVSALEEFMHKHQSRCAMSHIEKLQDKRIHEDYLETVYEREDKLLENVIIVEEIREIFRGFGV